MDTITTVSEARRGRVSAGEVELWVEQRGTGSDVLLIAGVGDPVEAWTFQLDGLADQSIDSPPSTTGGRAGHRCLQKGSPCKTWLTMALRLLGDRSASA